MEQMLERLLAGQEHIKGMMERQIGFPVCRMEDERKIYREDMRTNQENLLARLKTKLNAHEAIQVETKSIQGRMKAIRDKLDAHQEKTDRPETKESRKQE
jgi:hypothetical protein